MAAAGPSGPLPPITFSGSECSQWCRPSPPPTPSSAETRPQLPRPSGYQIIPCCLGRSARHGQVTPLEGIATPTLPRKWRQAAFRTRFGFIDGGKRVAPPRGGGRRNPPNTGVLKIPPRKPLKKKKILTRATLLLGCRPSLLRGPIAVSEGSCAICADAECHEIEVRLAGGAKAIKLF